MSALSPQERALWRRVAATVRPLSGRTPEPPLPAPAPPPASTLPAPLPLPTPRPLPQPPRLPCPPGAATLDGEWDRRLRTGRVEPDLTIDLHGLSVEAAHLLVERRLADAAARGVRLVLVITGKGSRGPTDRRGAIRAGLGDWLSLGRSRPLIAAVRPAHPRHGGSGAFYIVLKRRRER